MIAADILAKVKRGLGDGPKNPLTYDPDMTYTSKGDLLLAVLNRAEEFGLSVFLLTIGGRRWMCHFGENESSGVVNSPLRAVLLAFALLPQCNEEMNDAV